jgi:hypothetical protein
MFLWCSSHDGPSLKQLRTTRPILVMVFLKSLTFRKGSIPAKLLLLGLILQAAPVRRFASKYYPLFSIA